MTIKRITNGELKTFKHCRRRWWLSWYRGLRPGMEKTTGAAPLGTRVHECLAGWYSITPQDPLTTLQATYTRDLERIDPENVSGLKDLDDEVELARVMLEGYVQWLEESGADQGLTIVGVEEKVQVPFTDQAGMPAMEAAGWERVDMLGKLDMRVRRDLDNARLFLDHKTVGSIPDASKRLHMDEQMLHYDLLEFLRAIADGRANPDEPKPLTDGALYNMLRKVKRTVRANPPFYERVEIRHNVHELRSYWYRVWAEVSELATVEGQLRSGVPPERVIYPNPTRDCSWKCEFFSVCHMIDDGSDSEGMLNAFFRVADPLDRYEESEMNRED